MVAPAVGEAPAALTANAQRPQDDRRWGLARGLELRGPLGSAVTLMPLVLHISGETVESLLDETRPELAFLAAWAMQGRRGRAAMDVVVRALTISGLLEGDLRDQRRRGI